MLRAIVTPRPATPNAFENNQERSVCGYLSRTSGACASLDTTTPLFSVVAQKQHALAHTWRERENEKHTRHTHVSCFVSRATHAGERDAKTRDEVI